MKKQDSFVLWLDQIDCADVSFVGQKNAFLAQAYNGLSSSGVLIPNGFFLTFSAFRLFLSSVRDVVSPILSSCDVSDRRSVTSCCVRIRKALSSVHLPLQIEQEIVEGYKNLCIQYGALSSVAVRCSDGFGFPGHHESFLNIHGASSLVGACKRAFSSFFSEELVLFRLQNGIDHFSGEFSVAVQKLVDSCSSGVACSADLVSGSSSVLRVCSSYGFYAHTPDCDVFGVFRPSFLQGKHAIIQKELGTKKKKLVRKKDVLTSQVVVLKKDQGVFSLSDDDVLLLCDWLMKIESHFSTLLPDSGLFQIEWAKDSSSGKIYLLQVSSLVVSHTPGESSHLSKTKVFVTAQDPKDAFELSVLPSDGVGLLKLEFMLQRLCKVHPLALLHYDVLDAKTKKEISKIVSSDKPSFFVDTLACGIAAFAAAFFPRPVTVRLSDLTSDQYTDLIGGSVFEPKENNPLLGLRGAARFCHPDFEEAFFLECLALKKVVHEFGLSNIRLLVPFCRSVDEAKQVLSVLRRHDIDQEAFCLCEVPANLLFADAFLEVFDGFSIGSDDLTQLILGVDKSSSHVSHHYDVQSDAMKEVIYRVAAMCNEQNKHVCFTGDAVSDWLDMAEFVVRCGVSELSVSPIVLSSTIDRLHSVEQDE